MGSGDKMKKLTARQTEVRSFISRYSKEHLYPPTIREIAGHLGVSPGCARDHVEALRKKNVLEQSGGRRRTLKLTSGADCEIRHVEDCDRMNDPGNDGMVGVPIVGTIAAGEPILAEEDREGTLWFHPSELRSGRKYFALRVRGDSMSGAGIIEGDMAVIEQVGDVRNGAIAAVELDEEGVTLKRFYRDGGRIRLQPENPNYSPCFRLNVRVLGRLFRITRDY